MAAKYSALKIATESLDALRRRLQAQSWLKNVYFGPVQSTTLTGARTIVSLRLTMEPPAPVGASYPTTAEASFNSDVRALRDTLSQEIKMMAGRVRVQKGTEQDSAVFSLVEETFAAVVQSKLHLVVFTIKGFEWMDPLKKID